MSQRFVELYHKYCTAFAMYSKSFTDTMEEVFSLGIMTPEQTVNIFKSSGLAISNSYKSWDFTPVDSQAKEILYILRKA